MCTRLREIHAQTEKPQTSHLICPYISYAFQKMTYAHFSAENKLGLENSTDDSLAESYS